MENIFKDERMYMSDSEGDVLNIDEIFFDDVFADHVRKVFINNINEYGFIAVGDIIEIITGLLIGTGKLIKEPSYLSMNYGFVDPNFFKFELDHEPKRPGDTLWKLKIISSPVEVN